MNRKRIIIGLTVLVGIVLLGVLIFGGKGTKKATTTTNSTAKTKQTLSLADYASHDSRVELTIDGRVNGEDEHRSIRLTISPNNRSVELIQGYQNTIIKSELLDNNPDAYEVFMRALAQTGFGKERKSTITDERGICATGQRYIYRLTDGSNQKFRLWSASCAKGTSSGNITAINTLFQLQIPDYAKFVGNNAL